MGTAVFHSPKLFNQVVHVGDEVVASGALAPICDAIFARKFQELIARLEVANPGSRKTVGCLLKEKDIVDKRKRLCLLAIIPAFRRRNPLGAKTRRMAQ